MSSRAINARSETVLEKSTFRSAAVKRRSLVPAEGYYEWQKDGAGKIPTYLHPEDEGIVAFAGLYEFWRDAEVPEGERGEWLMTTTILTCPAADALGHIHDISVIVPADFQDEWLDPGLTDKGEIRTQLEGIPDPELVLPRSRQGRGQCAKQRPRAARTSEGRAVGAALWGTARIWNPLQRVPFSLTTFKSYVAGCLGAPSNCLPVRHI